MGRVACSFFSFCFSFKNLVEKGRIIAPFAPPEYAPIHLFYKVRDLSPISMLCVIQQCTLMEVQETDVPE